MWLHVDDEGDNDGTANTISSTINVNNNETEGTGIVSSDVRACDTDVSHQNRTDDLDSAIIPKAFTELNCRKYNYFGKAL